MKASIEYKHQNFIVDFSDPLDISLPLSTDKDSAKAWYVPPVSIEPVKMGDFVGSIEAGASVNFSEIKIMPHGHGTHTECVGHIVKEKYTINQCLKQTTFMALLISVELDQVNGDLLISKKALQKQVGNHTAMDALIIRTLPNDDSKKAKNYSETNPAYFSVEAMQYIIDLGVDHLLVDLPSVDKEKDNGALLCHKLFWNTEHNIQIHKTITELIYVPRHIKDGLYLLQLNIIPLESDASPSKPLLYVLKTK